MKAILDTNVVLRHLVGDHPRQSPRATSFLDGLHELMLPHVILAEAVFVLESVYRLERSDVSFLCLALMAIPSIDLAEPRVVVRALEIYAQGRFDFADAYAAATAEHRGDPVASFDRDFDRIPTVRRIEP